MLTRSIIQCKCKCGGFERWLAHPARNSAPLHIRGRVNIHLKEIVLRLVRAHLSNKQLEGHSEETQKSYIA